jgi:membrane dipeptidase
MAAVHDPRSLDARAADLHARAIVIDGQAGGTILNPAASLAGGVTAVVITLEQRPHDDFTAAGKQIAKHLDLLEYYRDQLLQVRTVADIERAKRERKLGLVFGFQTTTVLGNDPSLLSVFHALGIRYIQLTYMDQTLTGSGCLEPHDTGLTAFGLRVIREAERLGVVLDLSHVGRRTSLDALRHARKPCVFSHSNPAHFFDMARNVTDEQIRATAKTGGLVGITPIVPFYGEPGRPRPTVANVVDHIAYVAELVGVDHVAVASDIPEGYSDFAWSTGAVRVYADTIKPRPFDQNACVGFSSRAELPNVTAELVRRGASDDDILKILGGNWMRVYREVWAG